MRSGKGLSWLSRKFTFSDSTSFWAEILEVNFTTYQNLKWNCTLCDLISKKWISLVKKNSQLIGAGNNIIFLRFVLNEQLYFQKQWLCIFATSCGCSKNLLHPVFITRTIKIVTSHFWKYLKLESKTAWISKCAGPNIIWSISDELCNFRQRLKSFLDHSSQVDEWDSKPLNHLQD